MKMSMILLFQSLLFCSPLCSAYLAPASMLPIPAPIHHRLDIQLIPAVKSLGVVDNLTVEPEKTYRFLLNKNLQVALASPGDRLRILQRDRTADFSEYELQTGPEDREARLQYSGVIFDPVTNNDSSGLISPEGASLFGTSYWLPDLGTKATYEITSLSLPPDWKLASPKAQRNLPQQEIYLIAGAFQEYQLKEQGGPPALKIYLRQADPALAQTFLNLLPGYLDHYQKTLGAFPYESFAVIENFWETGFGMPGFTLLGPGVIRLPFILNSSLPHELLHNWWGNSVYVDYDRGNWCEGLTTYLADHWQQELLQAGGDYRRQSLMSFQDYTRSAKDFPLREFRQRFNFSSQAIGYGKGMMFFHMLKLRLGDDVFKQGLRDLYQNYQGQSISYEEIEESFQKTSGKNLTSFFKQWLDSTGAPKLQLVKLEAGPGPSSQAGAKFQVSFELQQVSPQIYDLDIPLRWILRDGSRHDSLVKLNTKQAVFQFLFDQAPRSLTVDPDFELWRDLAVEERPVSFSNVFGARKIFVVGTDAKVSETFAQTWQSALESQISLEKEPFLKNLPTEGAVVLLGDSPQYEEIMLKELAGQDFKLSPDAVTIFGQTYPKHESQTALVARSTKHPGLTLAWIRGSQTEDLAPRLLHYGKYGVLVFAAKGTPLKSTWPLLKSPLKVEWP